MTAKRTQAEPGKARKSWLVRGSTSLAVALSVGIAVPSFEGAAKVTQVSPLPVVCGRNAPPMIDPCTTAIPTGFTRYQALALKRSPKRHYTRVSRTTYNQAWAFIFAGQYARAERLLRASNKSVPPAFRWLIDDGLAWLAYYRKEYKLAEAAFQANVKKHPEAYLSRTGLGFVAMRRKEYAVAFVHLRQSFAQNPYQTVGSYTLPSKQLADAKQYESARDLLEMAEWVYPKSPDVKYLLAVVYKKLGDEKMAAQKAIAAANFAPAYIDPAFDKIGLDPAIARDAYLALGWGQYFAGNIKAAHNRFKAYVDQGGKNPNGRRGYVFTQFRLGRYAQAIPELKALAAIEPRGLPPVRGQISIPGSKKKIWVTYNSRTTLAWAYYRLHRPAQAEAEFRKALSRYPRWVDALTGLGYARLAQGERRGAAAAFRRALQYSPTYPDARQGLTLALRGK